MTTAAAAYASLLLRTGGRSIGSGRPRPDGRMRSTRARMAAPAIARRTKSSTSSGAWSNSASSAASVFLLRLPTGRPAGLPLSPGWKVMAEMAPFSIETPNYV
jgi:hypothetical protein